MEIRKKILIRASWIAILSNSVLAVLKIAVGMISGSLAVVADGIDSASDIATSFITLITSKIVTRPPNIRYPYGYEKADTLATKALSFIIFFAGAQLAISTVKRIITGNIPEIPGQLAIWVTAFSIVCKISLSIYLRITGKKANSSMLIANGKNMQNDVLISVAVLIGLFFIFILKQPLIDLLIAMLVSIWIMKVAVQIFFQTNVDIMDGMKDPILYCELFAAVKRVKGATNPHRVRVRKIGNFHMISMDIEVESEMKVKDAHIIAQQVEEEIRKSIPNVFDIIVHIEPLGNNEINEKYGINEQIIEDLEKMKK
jgi:cation diffusion facilitator family transporter